MLGRADANVWSDSYCQARRQLGQVENSIGNIRLNLIEKKVLHSCSAPRTYDRVLLAMRGSPRRRAYSGLAPKASKRPSQSFTTNSRDCHSVFASPRVNSTPRATNSA